ncbi:sensor histidine kinase [Paenibacillus sp. BC26]|uniref:sensor histidine kinase n=1 Tax=Paenibacillus sp. BC26 TaxID=1881032 RepID=UPI0008E1B8D5|nr:sensor histidine kinase [Paenibacillus sp. BC26]SFT27436.1 two-component system, sporulation sensor kinase E [Paenibacillus sp. BC26]
MSVKTKLSVMISMIVFVLLVLNVILNEYSTRVNLRNDIQLKMMSISQQVAANVIQNTREVEFVQTVLSDKMKLASFSAASQLPYHADEVTYEQLRQVAEHVGVSSMSLLKQRGENYYVVQSTNPPEIGDASNVWAAHKSQTIEQETLDYEFWIGPDKLTLTDNTILGQESFYTDRNLDYIIRFYMKSDQFTDLRKISHTTSLLTELKTGNPTILEITGFNPDLFGTEPIKEIPSIVSIEQLKESAVSFGSYEYGEIEKDKKSIKESLQGKMVFREETINDHTVMKSFFALSEPVPYVIGLVLDKSPIMKLAEEQRNNQVFISIVLLIVVVFCSYWLSDILLRPVRSILWKVNEVSFGRFDETIEVKRKDELGQLAQRVNAMSKNLNIYMTKLKMAFEENRSMKEYLESFINHTTDAIHVVDLDGRITQVNRAFEQLFGYTTEEAIGQMLPLVPEHLYEEEQKTMELLKSGKPLAARETLRVTKDGEWISVSATTSPIQDKHGELRAIASITRDMTGRNKMEELLRRSEKLTTVGQLAAGVAHEIRNPLTTLRGFLQLQLETEKLSTRHVDIMLSELDRINLIVSEFLILAKPQATRFEVKDVRFILGDVISLLDSQAHLCDIEFETYFDLENCRISCEENQLKQVFINVLKNAIEAMPEGGRITIEARRNDQHHVNVSITDEGIGIPEERIAKLGDPFYTDKDMGTGLGIMVSQRIIQTHQGMLEIRSKVNVGTTVTIVLPLMKEQAIEA